MTSIIEIENEFNKYSTNFGPDLVRKIPTASKKIQRFSNKIDTTMPANSITINEPKEDFIALITNKSPDYDEISSSAIKRCFSALIDPLKYLFEKSIEKGIFPDDLKLDRVFTNI